MCNSFFCFIHVDEVTESEGNNQDDTAEEILPLLNGITLEENTSQDNVLLTSCGVNDPNWETHLIEQAKNGFESDADEDDEEQGSKNSEEDQPPEIVDALLNIESVIE